MDMQEATFSGRLRVGPKVNMHCEGAWRVGYCTIQLLWDIPYLHGTFACTNYCYERTFREDCCGDL